MREKVKTQPDLSQSSPAHHEFRHELDKGQDPLRKWERNVIDRFKDKPDEEIKAELAATAWPFAVCFEQWIGDFNMGSGVRNANAFNAKEVFYLGNKKWDRRSSVGVYNYTNVQWLPTIDDLVKLQEKYVIVGIDNIPGKSVPLASYEWQPNTLMVFGEEGTGLSLPMQAFCRDIVEIEMYGSVRSLNCGVASGIVMHDFVSRITRNHSYFRERYDV
jgi:tRNA G18 (ribose-2'-O)-methylase SpoU